jgi:hypothetical protein
VALAKGYRAVPGTARKVRTPSGDVISHRQYRNLQAQGKGWRNLSEVENDQSWKKYRHKILEHDRGAKVNNTSSLAGDYVKVKRRREAVPPKYGPRGWRKDRSLEPLGREMGATPLGRLLAAMGAADESDIWGQYA